RAGCRDDHRGRYAWGDSGQPAPLRLSERPPPALPAGLLTSTASTPRLLRADTEQVLRPAHEQPPARDRRRGDDLLAQIVLRQTLELRPRFHPGDAPLAGKIALPPPRPQRRLVFPPHPPAPPALAGLGVQAVAPAVVLDEVEVLPQAHRRRHIGTAAPR